MKHDFLGCSSGKFPGAMFEIPVGNRIISSRKLQKTWAVIRRDVFLYFFSLRV